MANIIVFAVLAAVILCAAIFSVMTKSIMRAVTALLFVLFAIAGMYFVLDYTFLGTVQLSIYAGGMTMIYIFAIQLISKRRLQGIKEKLDLKRMTVAGLIALVGCATVIAAQFKTALFDRFCDMQDTEVPMEKIGEALVGADKYQYILPFEFISLFLLACIIGGLVVSRNHQEEAE